MKSPKTLIAEYEKSHPPMNNMTRMYSYIRPHKNGEATIEIWAAKNNRKKPYRLHRKCVYQFRTDRTKYKVRDMIITWFAIGEKLRVDFSETGYGRCYYAELNEPKGVWGYDKFKGADEFMPKWCMPLNGFENTKYKYCAYDRECGKSIMKYLELYRINPQIEILSKMKCWQLMTKGFLRKVKSNKALAKYVCKNANFISTNHVMIKELYDAFNHGVDIMESRRIKEEKLAEEQRRRQLAWEAEQAKRAMEMAKDYAKKYDKRIFKLYNEIKSLCRTYDCYEVVVPKNSKEMLEEGVALHNCVGSMYAPRQASGDDVCLFLHKDGKPCVALRIDPRTYEVKECRFVCNENCGEKEWEIARDIAKRMAKLAA